jgi:hypothetical protein
LFLLALTALFVVGALYSNYKLEDYEDDIRAQIEDRIDGELQFGKISLNGLRGLRIEDVELEWPIPNGPSLYIQSPVAYININLTELLYGKIALDRITLDYAQIELEPSQSGRWLNSEWEPPLIGDSKNSDGNSPFRISGNYCTIRIKDLTRGDPISLSRATLDIARLADSPKITGGINGFLARDKDKRININAEYVSPEDFTLRADCSDLTYLDINEWINSEEPFVLSGNVNPKIRIYGGTDQTVIFNILAPFSDLKLREHPDYIRIQSGYMSLFATYRSGSDEFNITTATVETVDWQGQMEGQILLASEAPVFDLLFQAEKFPLNDIVDEFIGDPIDEWGNADFALEAPYSLQFNLGGTPDALDFRAKLTAQSGQLTYAPDGSRLPSLALALGTVSGDWDSTTEEFTATIEIEDGEVNHSDYELQAEQLKGTLTLANNKLSLQPLNATIFDNTFVATLDYDLTSGTGKATLNGLLNEIENTAFRDNIKHTVLAGSLNIKSEILILEDRTVIDAYLDATQTDWGYQWWYTKPPGIGAMGAVHIEIDPEKSVVIDIDSDVASSKLLAQINMDYQTEGEAQGTFDMETITLSSNHLDINTISKCLNIPYEITGDNGMWGYFTWNKLPGYPGASRQDMNLYLNDINLIAESPQAESPIHLQNALVTLTLEDGEKNTGTLALRAEDGELPPFSQTWLIPADPPEGWPVKERDWFYQFDAKRLELPPWKGTNFRGEMFSTPTELGFNHYSADIGKGSLAGTYNAKRAENEYTTSINWSNVPAHYFLSHLNYPEVMTGDMTGEVTYTIDKDDPNTLKGNGYFETRNGDFTSDFLYALLQGNMDNPGSALPPTMNFSFFRSDVEFQGDKVLTPVLKLEADGMNLEGTGEFIRDGDLDYQIKVGIAPELAESIPALSSNFNLQGHKLANRDIDLAFVVGGPTFKPRGQLTELPPASVTLVHGALEMSRDAISIIDIPRKILVDLVKIGGGIVKNPKK